jgi:hypothetical protein
MANDTLTGAVTDDPLRAGIEVASEFVLPLPGGSNLVKGDFRQALIHAGLGIVARSLFGPIGVLLVSANSLSVALTNRNLTDNLQAEASSPAAKSAK